MTARGRGSGKDWTELTKEQLEKWGVHYHELEPMFHKPTADLFIDDKHGSKFYNEKRIKIPKEDNFTFEEVAELKVNTMGKAIFDQIIKKKAKYRIDGTYFLDTQFGNFPIKAKLVEKEL